MENETKNTITREFVEEELRFYNKEDIRSNLAHFGLFGAPLLLILFAGVCAVFANVESIWVGLLLCCLICAIMIFLIKKMLFPSLINALKEKKALDRGDFVIVTRRVTKKSTKTEYNKSLFFLHFDGFKEKEVWQNVFMLTSEGDEFYIVHYKKQDAIKLMYPAKTHEYKER